MRAPGQGVRTFEFRILGSPRICPIGGSGIDALIHQPKRIALLAYLAAAAPRGPQRRDKLLGIFWPESDAHHARAALSQALYVLRTHLGENAVRSHADDEITLDRNIVWCDCVAFEEQLDAGQPEQAMALYRADLLDSFFLSDVPAFEQWLDQERERLRLRAADGAWQLAVAAADAGRAVDAARWARRASDVVPTDEVVARRLMSFLHEVGDRAAAVRAYEAFAWRLAHEYELEPSPETQALAARLRGIAPTAPVARAPAPPEVALIHVPTPIALEPARPRVVDAPRGRASARGGWAVALALVVVALIWGTSRARGSRAEPTMRLPLELMTAPPVAVPLRGSSVAVSPNGELLAYVGFAQDGTQLFIRALDRLETGAIPHTRGANLPFFSPDGAWLGFTHGDTLRKVRVHGGAPMVVSVAPGPVFGASWGRDDMIVFATPKGLWQVSANGGVPRALGPRTERGQLYRWPDVLPKGKAVLFTLLDSGRYRLASMALDDGTVASLGVEGTNPRFVAPGFLVFIDGDGDLLAAPFDEDAARIIGDVRRLPERVFVGGGGGAKLGLSSSGMLAYVPDAADRTLVLVDRSGRADTLPLAPRAFDGVRFSPDGRYLALTIRAPDASKRDIWMLGMEHRTLRRLTADTGAVAPVWMPDGSRVVFASNVGGREVGFAFHSQSLDVREPTRTIRTRAMGLLPAAITPDGRALLFENAHHQGQRDVWTLRLDGRGAERPYLDSQADEHMPAVSPNGRWVAFVSDATGRREVYLAAFPRADAPIRVSASGGAEPLWSPNGRELFYRTRDGLMAVTLRTTPTPSLDEPQLLFDDADYVSGFYSRAYDVHPDGQRFAMVRRGSNEETIVVVLNWFEQLRRSRQDRTHAPP